LHESAKLPGRILRCLPIRVPTLLSNTMQVYGAPPTSASAPEPATMNLFTLALIGLPFVQLKSYRRRKKASPKTQAAMQSPLITIIQKRKLSRLCSNDPSS